MWQESLKGNVKSISELAEVIPMSREEQEALLEITQRFPMSITRYYLDLIDKNDSHDPLRKLVIPCETEFDKSGLLDTSGEAENTKINGVQHKYGPTALMLSTNRCASYCRFCFRKRLVGFSDSEVAKRIEDVAEYVRNHPEISNVLISGGDPLMNNNSLLDHLIKLLVSIDSIKYIRIGTHMLSVLPERVYGDSELLKLLEKYSKIKQIYVITHYDHPRELTNDSIKAIRSLLDAGIALKNQTVLMKGVNDDPQILSNLMNGLAAYGVAPYYLFQCRPVLGVKDQFQVPFTRAIQIVEEAKKTMSGPAKQFRYAMSHVTGKIEIVGMLNEQEMIFKYHQAKDLNDNGRIFTVTISDQKAWLDESDIQRGNI